MSTFWAIRLKAKDREKYLNVFLHIRSSHSVPNPESDPDRAKKDVLAFFFPCRVVTILVFSNPVSHLSHMYGRANRSIQAQEMWQQVRVLRSVSQFYPYLC